MAQRDGPRTMQAAHPLTLAPLTPQPEAKVEHVSPETTTPGSASEAQTAECHPSPRPPGTLCRDTIRNMQRLAARMRREDIVGVLAGKCLGEGRAGGAVEVRTYDACFALKIVDFFHWYKEEEGAEVRMAKEAEVYKQLASHQGITVPHLFAEDGWLNLCYLLMQRGTPAPLEEWTDGMCLLAREALDRLHAAGFAHGDVADRNFVFVKDDGTHDGPGTWARALLIDLESAEPLASAGRDKGMFARMLEDRRLTLMSSSADDVTSQRA
jgi:hypothetical protein